MVNGMDIEFLEFRHQEHDILFTRFERISLTDAKVQEEAKYLYLIFIFHKQHKKELKEKMKEEVELLAKARQAIKAKNELEERNYNLLLNPTVGERKELGKMVNEHEIFIKNH